MTPEANYTEIEKKIRLKEELSEKEKQTILKIGMDFVTEEIKSSTISWQLSSKSKEFQEYLPYITLVRLVTRYNEIKKYERNAEEKHDVKKLENLSEVTSVKLFKQLEGEISGKLKIKDTRETDFAFEDMIIDVINNTSPGFNVEKYIIDIGGEEMKTLSSFASKVVPSNPDLSASEWESIYVLD